jgi:putative nucleotidyltransferase with HDIG domain
MSASKKRLNFQLPGQRNVFLGILMLVSIGLVFLALELPIYARLSAPQLQAGEVAPQDIVAPRPISYVSEVRTQLQKDAAARAVAPIYTSPDTSIARRQLERLRAALAYITSVRADSYATPEQKVADLAALEDIHLNQDTAQKILALTDSRWQAVQQEAIVVLEQVMRSTIREDRVEEARRSIPALVSLSLSEEQSEIVAELVSGLVAPNSFYSEDLTTAAREQAREAVEPVTRSYVQGETIVQRGQVLTATDIEALQELELVQPPYTWKDWASAGTLVLLATLFLLLYLRRKPKLTQDVRGLTVISVLFIFSLVTGRLIVTGHTILPYAFPLAAFSLIVASLFGAEPALIFTLPLAILYAYDLPNSLDLTLYALLGGFFGVLTLGTGRRISSYFWSAVAIAVAGASVIVAYRLTQPSTDLIGISTLMGISLLNGIASPGLTLLLQFFLAQFLGMTTALQLMEISRPDHKLMQLLLRNAPGTYQHSLQVANLAEQAAEQIGADPLLTRVGSLYHDAGKALNPYYFIENQVSDSLNPHDDLDPATSAATIIHHVTDGLELAREYRLPRRIQDFIAEHHGTMLTRYQYAKALEVAGGDESKVEESQFRYPGPRPQSRETAILMLADGSEARMRAERPKDAEELRTLIKNTVENRVAAGQLDDTDLTLRDLETIVESFTTTLRGIYHPRIEYPKIEKRELPSPKMEPTPTLPSGARSASDVPVKSPASHESA